MNQSDLKMIATTIIDSNMYMVLGTVDETGNPWVAPVYYASARYSEFYWVSSPEAMHSRNIARHPQISIVIFNSQARIGTGQGVYMSAFATQLSGVELDQGIEIFSRTSLRHGASAWKREDVQENAMYRLYRSYVSEHWILDPAGHPDHRISVNMSDNT
jgi:uncharacterized protein YhbP (UPF0306 family)